MTVGVCLHCGEPKTCAFDACPSCGHEPTTCLDQARHLLATAHYRDETELADIGRRVRRGGSWAFDEDQLENASALCSILMAPGSMNAVLLPVAVFVVLLGLIAVIVLLVVI